MSKDTRQVRFGYTEQSVFNTPEADDVAIDEVTCDPFDIDPDVMIFELPENHGDRKPTEQNTVHSIKGSSAKFSVIGPVDLNDIDQFAYTHFQKVVEGADTEFTKTFTYFSDHPDFSADEGHFLTWTKRLPTASSSQKCGGCIASRLKLSGERDGMLMFEADFVSLGTSNDVSNPSGTWTPRTGADIVEFNDINSATLSHGADLSSPTNLTIKSFEVEGVWEHEKCGHDSVIGFEQHAMKTISGSFKIKMLRDVTADEALVSLKTGELVSFSVDLGTITITVTGKIESLEYDTEGLLVNEISCRMLSSYTAGSVGECFTLVVQNTVDRSWPAA